MLHELLIPACSGVMAVHCDRLAIASYLHHGLLDTRCYFRRIANLYGHGAISIDRMQQRADVRN